MYCKCKDNTSFKNSYFLMIGQIYQCYWYDNEHTIMQVIRIMPWDPPVLVDRADFLRCFDYWE